MLVVFYDQSDMEIFERDSGENNCFPSCDGMFFLLLLQLATTKPLVTRCKLDMLNMLGNNVEKSYLLLIDEYYLLLLELDFTLPELEFNQCDALL